MANFTNASVIKAVTSIGLKVKESVQPNYFEDLDGEVTLADGRSIQVGSNYLMIVKVEGEKFIFSNEIKTLAQLKRELQRIECSECKKVFENSGEWNAHDCLSHLTIDQLETRMREKGLL